jgi:hypothetical protein
VNLNKAKRIATRPLCRVCESRILKFLERDKLSQHIGVIHDGHRRYARAEGLPDDAASYREGTKKFVEFLGRADDFDGLNRVAAQTDAWIAVTSEHEEPSGGTTGSSNTPRRTRSQQSTHSGPATSTTGRSHSE